MVPSIPGKRILNVDARTASTRSCRKRALLGICGSSATHPIRIALPKATIDPMYVRAPRDIEIPSKHCWVENPASEAVSVAHGGGRRRQTWVDAVAPYDAE